MRETSIRVMNMVRRTIRENPDVTDRTLYAAAIALEPSMAELSLKQFQARYPRRVRRLELGQTPPRRRDEVRMLDERPLSERPLLYFPGQETLPRESLPLSKEVSNDARVHRRTTISTSDPASRERSDANPPGAEAKRRDNASRESTPPLAAVAVDDEHHRTSSVPIPATEPWPLRLRQNPSSIHSRKKQSSTKLSQRTRNGRHGRPSTELDAIEGRPGNVGADAATVRADATTVRADDARLDDVDDADANILLGGDASERRRPEIRKVLLAWAQEIVGAETRGELVAVLARADRYVDEIIGNSVPDATAPPAAEECANRSSVTGSHPEPGITGAVATRPDLRRRGRIEAYDPAELDAIVRWIARSAHPRSDEELVEGVLVELGFKRRGRRLLVTIREAVERVQGM